MTISTLIEKFSVNALKDFFRERIDTFKPDVENYEYLFDENENITDNYYDIVKIGEADLTNTDDILVFTAKTLTQLTGRTGKKGQYEIAKKILKEEDKDAAFFIFYDDDGNFRFSLIRVNFLGAKRDFTDFKRYTYFVSPKQTNKTFINQILKCDFNSLDSIQEAFSVEPITKQFYEKLQRWYFWAIENVEFPRDAEQETNGREVAIIRLITRLMFIWFMKVRNLIPTDLFDEKNIRKMLKDFSREESTYYKAILQNLFFATLNTEQKDRKFRSEFRGAKGYNPDFGNQNVFRYHNLFSDSESLKKLFGEIPFLNGGLFECLDYKTKDKNERKYIDGFTATKEQQPKVPNFLFFSEIEKVDISSFFGKANKTYEVEGLINLLNSYNFTIDENEPDDVEVALDPELLGSIFENLLASYNPETATTARKATGSFYTPREIVNYMTNESLKQYFRQGIGSILLSNKPKQDDLDTIFLNPNDEIIIKHGKLPHWTQENSWYFITFRLADSIPKQKVEQLKKERELWFEKHRKKDRTEYSKEELKEYYYLFSERVENWLNAGHGKCVLKNKLNAEIVANAIKYFDGKRYELDEWVVMPNHVHVLVKPFENYSISDITHSWKSFSANEINKNINSSGQLWMHESYDHIVRNEKAFRAIKNYIKQNPQKAGIVPKASSFQKQQQTGTSGFQEHDQITKQDALDTLFGSSSENPFDDNYTKQIIKLINNLRVVDPAVGSGAFPMAMLNKLVFILNKLDPDNKQWKQSQIDGVKKSVSDSVVQRKLIEQIERQFKEKNADYGRKLYLIEKCIYGVDIQQIAVEIAKLRFFISLLVDEKIDFDKPENNYGIEPLPNLDFKLMQGNSLISTYAGIDFNDKKEKPTENLLFDADEPYKKLIKEFEELKHQYQNEPDKETKNRLRTEIDQAILKIFEQKISEHIPQLKNIEQKHSVLPNKEQRQKAIAEEKQKLTKNLGFDIEKDLIAYTEGRKEKDFFLWNVYFAEVFSEKGGFDVVIGNPPYVGEKGHKNIFRTLKKEFKARYAKNSDLFYFFFMKSIDMLRDNGNLAFITTNYYLTADSAIKLRTEFKNKTAICNLVNFNEMKIFESALGQHNIITILRKTEDIVNTNIINIIESDNIDFNDKFINGSNVEVFTKESEKLFDGANNYIRLSNQETILENVFNKMLQNYKLIEDICFINTGFNSGADKVTKSNLNQSYISKPNNIYIGDGVFIINEKEYQYIRPENELVYKCFKNSDIEKYRSINWQNLYVIWTNKDIDIDNYPNIKMHLNKYRKFLEIKREYNTGQLPWFSQHWAREYDVFGNNDKIVFPYRSKSNTFSYSDTNYFGSKDILYLRKNDTNFDIKYLLALLNSKLYYTWLYFKGKRKGETLELYVTPISQIPIKNIEKSKQKPFEILVDKIISKKERGEDTTAEEREIDLMVYKLYELTYDEVKIVEPKTPISKNEYENFEL
jgi:adenine-specific DNA-methyltransferase